MPAQASAEGNEAPPEPHHTDPSSPTRLQQLRNFLKPTPSGTFGDMQNRGMQIMADNKYLLTGYRLNYNSWAQCFFSLFQMHNETLNVWTHLVGALIFLGCIVGLAQQLPDSVAIATMGGIGGGGGGGEHGGTGSGIALGDDSAVAAAAAALPVWSNCPPDTPLVVAGRRSCRLFAIALAPAMHRARHSQWSAAWSWQGRWSRFAQELDLRKLRAAAAEISASARAGATRVGKGVSAAATQAATQASHAADAARENFEGAAAALQTNAAAVSDAAWQHAGATAEQLRGSGRALAAEMQRLAELGIDRIAIGGRPHFSASAVHARFVELRQRYLAQAADLRAQLKDLTGFEGFSLTGNVLTDFLRPSPEQQGALHKLAHRAWLAVEGLELKGEAVTGGAGTAAAAASALTAPGYVARWPIFVFLVTALCCLLFSAIFHLFYTQSNAAYQMLVRLDFAGISLLITGSFFPFLYYSFWCSDVIVRGYLVTVGVFGSFVFVISLFEFFSQPKFFLLRIGSFVGFGAFAIVPLVHMGVRFGPRSALFSLFFWDIVSIAGLYVVGVVFYACRIPERWVPYKFDRIGASHQLWHIFVFGGAFLQYLKTMEQLRWRQEHNACSGDMDVEFAQNEINATWPVPSPP